MARKWLQAILIGLFLTLTFLLPRPKDITQSSIDNFHRCHWFTVHSYFGIKCVTSTSWLMIGRSATLYFQKRFNHSLTSTYYELGFPIFGLGQEVNLSGAEKIFSLIQTKYNYHEAHCFYYHLGGRTIPCLWLIFW